MIIYKTAEEIAVMRKSNQIVARVLTELKALVRPGVRTRELDAYAEARARELGAVPAFKGYRGYPASLCTSVNEEIIHGIPSERPLKEGDIIGLDFGVLFEGFYGDAAVTIPVGSVGPTARRLIDVAEAAFYKGIEQMKKGNRISDISHAVQEYVEGEGFSVIRSFVGHGIGHSPHEEPQVPNFGPPGRGPKIKEGLTLAIEPMIAVGDWQEEILDDGWTAVTRDRSLSAHYEHTVALTRRGVEILSLGEPGKPSLISPEEKPYA
ncbi:MAG: type I methionyl aminopeptidase [Candidatus Aminicenantes bacterium RBG_13_63_10]|jgi:methionyl aminopeptidase|nr:MAG: type I methionyl aminopeptidase [Candidatus Aminicenantes bacterium RBG_13_63_10]